MVAFGVQSRALCRWETIDLRGLFPTERTVKAFAMSWFKKLLQKKDARQSKSEPATTTMFKWWKKSPIAEDEQSAGPPLQREIDVVPKTEIQASRQTLNNINLTFGESSSVDANNKGKHSENSACTNKYCCDTRINVQPDEVINNGDDESIKNHRNSKATLSDNLRAADNNEHAPESIFDETVCRPSKAVKNAEYIIHFDPYADYGRLECPDSAYPSTIDFPSVRYGRYVELKSRKDRNYSDNYDLFTKSDSIKSIFDKATINYRLLSNVEKNIDESKHNLLKCRIYNHEYDEIRAKLGLKYASKWRLEDFNDDNKSTRMSADTRTIKEFFRLSNDNNILVHYEDIDVQTGRLEEEEKPNVKEDFIDFIVRIFIKGKEITERHTAKSSWIKELLKFFRKKSEWKFAS